MLILVALFPYMEVWAGTDTPFLAQDTVKYLEVDDITSTGAVLFWEDSVATQWQVSFSTDEAFVDSLTRAEVVNQTQYELTGLQNKTLYYVRVRSYNDDSDYGVWSDTVRFITLPPIITEYPWRESFDGMRATTDGGKNNLPLGWRYIM